MEFSHRRQQRNSRTHVQRERVLFQQETLVPWSPGGQIRAVCGAHFESAREGNEDRNSNLPLRSMHAREG